MTDLEEKRYKAGKLDEISFTEVSRRILLLFAFSQAIFLVVQYVSDPVRSTGFFLDYSQASLILLVGFGLNYLWLKDNPRISLLVIYIMFIGFFATFSRTSNFLLLLFIVAMALIELRQRQAKFLLFATLAIAFSYVTVMLIPELLGESAVSRGGLAEFSTLNSRSYYWQSAILAIRDNPWWGSGLGNFEFLGIKEMFPYNRINSVHNDYLQVWVDLGMFWLILFIGAVLIIVVTKSPLFRAREEWLAVDIKNISWLLLASFSLYMLINFIAYTFIFQIVSCLLLAELTNHDKAEDS